MEAFKIWIISGWLHLVIGIGAGWVLFKRPEWAEAIYQWIKHKVRPG